MAHDHDHRDFQPDEEESLPDYGVAEIAVRELLLEKGIFTAEEFRGALEGFDRAAPERGAKIVARAWTDADFKARLMADGSKVVEEYGVNMDLTELYVVENTPDVHNVIVCTLCSCYPKPLLGAPPDWYKSRNYRMRAVREPRAVLAEFGTHLADDVQVRVHDSTADMRYIVLPMRPAGTEGMSAEELEGLVSRDCMIGTAVPGSPAKG